MKKFIIVLLLFFPLITQAALFKSSDGKVWTEWNDKRRWIRTLDIFNSYNFDWKDVSDITDFALADIAINNLIRVEGQPEVYALNDNGYKRHIHNPDIFNSYNLSWEDVADINETELAGYPDCNLLKEAGKDTIYKLEGTTIYPISDLETFNALGFDWNALQIINQEDFSTYNLGVEISYQVGETPVLPPVWNTPETTPTNPTTPPEQESPIIPEVVKDIQMIIDRKYNPKTEIVAFDLEVRYTENGERKEPMVKIYSDNGEFVSGSGCESGSGGIIHTTVGQRKGNPITCPSRKSSGRDGKPCTLFGFIPEKTGMITITVTVGDFSKDFQVMGKVIFD